MGIFKIIKDVVKAVDDGLDKLSDGLDTFNKNMEAYSKKMEEYNKKMEHENTIKKNAVDSFFAHLDQVKGVNTKNLNLSQDIHTNFLNLSKGIHTKYLNKEDNEIFAEEIRELSSECMIVYVKNYFNNYIDLGRDAYIEKIQQENPHIDTIELKNAIEDDFKTYKSLYERYSKSQKYCVSSLSDKVVYFSAYLLMYDDLNIKNRDNDMLYSAFETSKKAIIHNLSLDYKNNYNHLSLDDYLKKLQEEGFIFNESTLRKELMYI